MELFVDDFLSRLVGAIYVICEMSDWFGSYKEEQPGVARSRAARPRATEHKQSPGQGDAGMSGAATNLELMQLVETMDVEYQVKAKPTEIALARHLGHTPAQQKHSNHLCLIDFIKVLSWPHFRYSWCDAPISGVSPTS